MDPYAPRCRQSLLTLGIATKVAQGGQATLLESALIPPDCACRTIEGTSYVLLSGPSLLDEIDHRVSLGHLITQQILCQDNPRHHHHTVFILRPD